ncbi:MAG: hypothetical protein U0003_04500 [Vampirovibrionales bacterium]
MTAFNHPPTPFNHLVGYTVLHTQRWLLWVLALLVFHIQHSAQNNSWGQIPNKSPAPSLLAPHCSTEQQAAYATQPLQALVNEANQLAESQAYLPALCRYWVAQQRDSTNPTLHNNMAVLVFNQAIALQQQASPALSREWLVWASQLQPHNTEPKQALAASYFNEAMALRKSEPEPWSPETFTRISQALQTAQTLYPSLPHTQRALGMTYLQYAVGLQQQSQWAEALTWFKQASQLLPNEPELPALKAQTLVQWAQTLDKNDPQRKALLEEAQATDPEVAPQAKQLLAGKPLQQKSLANSTHDPNLSLAEQVSAVEYALGIHSTTTLSLPERLSQAEKATYGKSKEGSIALRTQRLYHSVLGSGQSVMDSPTELKTTIQTVEGTYLESILTTTEGRVIRWSRFPLSIAIEWPEGWEPNENRADKNNTPKTTWPNLAPTQAEVIDAIHRGINHWVTPLQQLVSVVWTNRPDEADVVIRFKDHYTDRFSLANAQVLPSFSVPKVSQMAKALGIASMLTPGIASLGPQAGAAVLQYRELHKFEQVREESQLVLGQDLITQPQALMVIENICTYEFGQILGLKGISSDPSDSRHPSTPQSNTIKVPSQKDIATLKALYQRPASIVLNIH